MSIDVLKIRSKLFLVRCSLERLGLSSGVAIVDEAMASFDAMANESRSRNGCGEASGIKAIAAVLNKHRYRAADDWKPGLCPMHKCEMVSSRTSVAVSSLLYFEAAAVAEKLERDEPDDESVDHPGDDVVDHADYL